MKFPYFPIVGVLLCGCASAQTEDKARAAQTQSAKTMSLYDFKLQTLDGKDADLSAYKGKALLIINTASKCGYTAQYAGLQKLQTERAKDGLVVLGFPSNDFGGQEPGNAEEIAQFCQKNFGVTFALFAKGAVKGEAKQPLFAYLTKDANPELKGEIGWNFEKFLVSREGKLVARFKSGVKPDGDELTRAVASELEKK